ncbi:hypothetical protein K503DRAFT_801447 [Rhizopogon vinicolor AM-OR11-026]|uniref:Uncharacterized protein n=1 Tax=Rhizopogon vinicolor AM-OR11-026 TaxID=1314800 RepID=A0A1B7MX40_9AGAM|nr:hypothetical protein K503DRAFT_801447 [Rhizopogon vinicolor AM-OR11-026]
MKSCLKSSPSHSGAATPIHTDPDTETIPCCKKRVAFCEEGTEQVFQADEWDRTPTEIAQRLSYEDVLELKMIQRSLPRAQQQHDPLSSRPYSSVFLRHVPIPLLPLNPTTISASGSPTFVSTSPSSPPIRSPHSSPPRRTGYPALDLHPNSIFFSSPPKRRSKPTSPPPTQPKPDSSTPLLSPPSFKGFKPHNVPAITPPPPAPSELKPHNIAVPPPPVPPARTSTFPLPPIPSNLPPPKRFAFLPLLDSTSSSSSKKESEQVLSPRTDSTLSPAPSPTHHDHHYPRSDSSLSEMETCYSSDTDCSLFASDTEFSTPSLTTASLASSSPPESPRMPYTDSPPFEQDNFILNLDTDPDIDTTPVPDSYFPRMPTPMSMSSLAPTPTPNPVSSFHSRYPHRPLLQTHTHTQTKPSLMAVPSPELPAPSPLDLCQRNVLVPGPRKKLLMMPIVALAEAPTSFNTRGREGCEYGQGQIQGHAQGQGRSRSRQLSLSRS